MCLRYYSTLCNYAPPLGGWHMSRKKFRQEILPVFLRRFCRAASGVDNQDSLN